MVIELLGASFISLDLDLCNARIQIRRSASCDDRRIVRETSVCLAPCFKDIIARLTFARIVSKLSYQAFMISRSQA